MKRLPTVKKSEEMWSPDKGSFLCEEDFYMNERALMAIVSTLDGYPEPQDSDLSQSEIEEFAFSKSALNEILDLVWDHPWKLASDTIEQFAIQMEVYMATAITDDQKRIFTVAAKTAWKLLQNIELVER